MEVLYVAAGGAVGSALRYLIGLAANRLFGTLAFPLGTFVVNVLGSLALGVMLATFAAREGSLGLRLALTTGVMGGFTTYSTFNYEVYRLLTGGQAVVGAAYLVATVAVCLGGTMVGIAFVR